MRDIVNVVGFGLTFVGLFVAWRQLRKTQSAASAAETAAKRAVEENRFAYLKFAAALAHRNLHEAKIHVDNKTWVKAALRTNDLAEQLAQLEALDKTWGQFS